MKKNLTNQKKSGNSLKAVLFCFVLLLSGLMNLKVQGQCANATHGTDVSIVPTSGLAVTSTESTYSYWTINTVPGYQYLIYDLSADYVTAWGSANGTGLLGYALQDIFIFPTGTTTWVDLNRTAGCGTNITAGRTIYYQAVPLITGALPSGVLCAGNTITVTEQAFSGVSLVTFTGGATAVPSSVTSTSFNVVIPAGAQSGGITTLNTGNASINITAGQATTALNLESATGVTSLPSAGGVGYTVTINGYNLLGATNMQ